MGLGPLAPVGEGAITLQFLPGLSAAAGATRRVFPLQLIKSPYQEVQSYFCTPWRQNFILAKILLVVQLPCWKIS